MERLVFVFAVPCQNCGLLPCLFDLVQGKVRIIPTANAKIVGDLMTTQNPRNRRRRGRGRREHLFDGLVARMVALRVASYRTLMCACCIASR